MPRERKARFGVLRDLVALSIFSLYHQRICTITKAESMPEQSWF